jgi:hypothetical protein
MRRPLSLSCRPALRPASALLLLLLCTAGPGARAQEAGAPPPGSGEPPAGEAQTAPPPPPPETATPPPPETPPPAPEAGPEGDPLDRVQLATCPCWTTPLDLLREIQYAHSEISFECFVTSGTFSVELSAYSGGTGGPYQSQASTPQPQPSAIPRCRHVKVQPRVEISSSGQIQTLGQVNACISIVTDVAARLGCKN